MNLVKSSDLKSNELPFPSLGKTGFFRLLDIPLTGIISSRMRHVIKRYLKRIGFRELKIEHVSGDSPFILRLVAIGRSHNPISIRDIERIEYLRESLIKVLNETGKSHPSKADPEKLRIMLAKVEPSLKRVYYVRKK